MAGYREITIAGEGRSPRPKRTSVRVAPERRVAGWRGVAMRILSHGFAMGKVACREKPGSVFGGVVALVAAGFICVNALDSQKGRHPAPILPKVAPKVAAKAPPPAPTPARQEAVRDVAREPVPAPAANPASPKPTAPDRIAELIRAEDTTASVNPRTKPAAAKAEASAPAVDPAVSRAQRALAKLGYGPIKADGAMGPATKAAIEKFERDRKLPVTGEAAGKTLRALETGAGKG